MKFISYESRFFKKFFLSFFLKQEQIVFINWEIRESQVKMFCSCESQVKIKSFDKNPQIEEPAENTQDSNSSKN